MSSLLTFQLNQQQQLFQQTNSLPSPPSSFCGDDADATISNNKATTGHLAVPNTKDRRDSLQKVFGNMTLKEYPSSMPENYTIEHSVRKAEVATAAATGGLTIRHRRQSEDKRKLLLNRNYSESYTNGIYRCHDCGKSYKHPNCLSKHRWEHSEEWELTSKLPLTKHQQVQMLEAAAILVSMDNKQEKEDDDDIEVNIDNDDNGDGDNDDESIVIDDDEEDDRMSYASEEIFLEDL
ncbi:hypothetical protein K501DRAFT_289364 [Backusella circina FSU 941]|nr:hypothetical protein K501DRAFT_289364 [Backusella circina FSU 941]